MVSKNLFLISFISLASGIIAAEHFSFRSMDLLILLSIPIVLTIVRLFLFNKIFVNSLLLISLIFLCGIGVYQLQNQNTAGEEFIDHLYNRKIFVKGTIGEIDCINKNKIKFILASDEIGLEGKILPIKISSLVEITPSRADELSLNVYNSIIKIGNVIQIEGYFKKPVGQIYPGDFDYLKYLEWKNVSGLITCNEYSRIDLLEHYKYHFSFGNLISDLRLKIINQIDKNLETNTGFLLRGLLTGDRSEIPADVKTNFVNSGVAHVLAVSGLHTGYILIILIALSGRFNKYIQFFLVSLGLMLFIQITNASPSVIRASSMAILWLATKLLQRKSNLLSTISISGIIILMLKPNDLFNPGFQLSFGAVLSIALVYPLFDKLKGKLVNKIPKFPMKNSIIDLFLVSLAVQIGTLPFVIGYYEKLSIISLVANIFVIPLIGIILASGIISLITLNIFPFLFSIYELASSALVNITLNLIKAFGEVSFAFVVIDNYSSINAVIYFFFIGFFIYFFNRSESKLFRAILPVSVICLYMIYFPLFQKKYLENDQTYLIIMETENISSISVIDPNSRVIKIRKVKDSSLINELVNEVGKCLRINERLLNDELKLKLIEGFTLDEIKIIDSELDLGLNLINDQKPHQFMFSSNDILVDTNSSRTIFSNSVISPQIRENHTLNKYLIDTKHSIILISDSNAIELNPKTTIRASGVELKKGFLRIYSEIGIDSMNFLINDIENKSYRFTEAEESSQNQRRILGTRIFKLDKNNIEEIDWRKI